MERRNTWSQLDFGVVFSCCRNRIDTEHTYIIKKFLFCPMCGSTLHGERITRPVSIPRWAWDRGAYDERTIPEFPCVAKYLWYIEFKHPDLGGWTRWMAIRGDRSAANALSTIKKTITSRLLKTGTRLRITRGTVNATSAIINREWVVS